MKAEIKKKRKLMKYAKDSRARKEWGSNEFVVVNDDYVPIPNYESKKESSP